MLGGNGTGPNNQQPEGQPGQWAQNAPTPHYTPAQAPTPPYPLSQAPTPPYAPGQTPTPPYQQGKTGSPLQRLADARRGRRSAVRQPSAHPDGTPAPLPASVIGRVGGGGRSGEAGGRAHVIRRFSRSGLAPKTKVQRQWRRLAVAAASLVLLVACLIAVFALPSNPVLAVIDQLESQASVTATGGDIQANVTLPQRTATAGGQPSGPTATGGRGAGGGGGNPGASGGGTIQPTVTPTARATATATRVPPPNPTPTNPPPPPPTYFETTSGYGSLTWTDYKTAGGSSGQYVQPYATIQITCRLTGYMVPDGDTWWYRIAQSPWNNQYYASADNFYNNGQTSGPPNSVFVDLNVPSC